MAKVQFAEWDQSMGRVRLMLTVLQNPVPSPASWTCSLGYRMGEPEPWGKSEPEGKDRVTG